jgi:hypothetical protein
MDDIFVGSIVKYTREDNEEDKATGCYPPIGTPGTVISVDDDTYVVRWNYGTREGEWYCEHTDVERVVFQNNYSYSELKRELERTCGLSEKEIYYIIGIFFDKTDGYQMSHTEVFYGIKENTNICVSWTKDTYSWDIEVVPN